MTATVNGYEVRVINGGLVADRDRPVSGSEGITAGPQTTYTQTYSTASATVPNATFVAPVTTATTQTTPFGFATQAQGDAVVTGCIANAADILAVKKVVTKIIDDLQALDLAG